MRFTEFHRKHIFEVGISQLGCAYHKGYKCHDFVHEIYSRAGISSSFDNCPQFSFPEIWEEKAVYYPLFLRRKETLVSKRITHIGIIFPGNQLLHYSRWMKEERIYEVLLSSFREVFRVYNFVEPHHP